MSGLVVSQIDGGLGRKIERPLSLLYPLDKRRKYIVLKFFLVADEVVIYKKDPLPPAKRIYLLKFRDYLPTGLCPWDTAVKRRNVTKFTVKGTSPGILDVHGGILLHIY